MRKDDLQGLRSKTIDKLAEMVDDKRLELVKLRSSTKAGREKNLKKVKSGRREIARILTVIREKQIIEQSRSVSDGQSESKKEKE